MSPIAMATAAQIEHHQQPIRTFATKQIKTSFFSLILDPGALRAKREDGGTSGFHLNPAKVCVIAHGIPCR
jgi:hypothetical protein